jgi:hypothetical protein
MYCVLYMEEKREVFEINAVEDELKRARLYKAFG